MKIGRKSWKNFLELGGNTLWSLSYDDGVEEEEEEILHPKPSLLRISKIRLRLLTVRGDVRGAAAVAVGRLGSFDVEVQ